MNWVTSHCQDHSTSRTLCERKDFNQATQFTRSSFSVAQFLVHPTGVAKVVGLTISWNSKIFSAVSQKAITLSFHAQVCSTSFSNLLISISVNCTYWSSYQSTGGTHLYWQRNSWETIQTHGLITLLWTTQSIHLNWLSTSLGMLMPSALLLRKQ